MRDCTVTLVMGTTVPSSVSTTGMSPLLTAVTATGWSPLVACFLLVLA
ncbi:hypothetical protein AA15237_2368 [Komagataeibacter xylinus NBRC 15237]|nr:hypothetical protein AA15237_2368 [Komagataeibacter xylinus NBRC 15237]